MTTETEGINRLIPRLFPLKRREQRALSWGFRSKLHITTKHKAKRRNPNPGCGFYFSPIGQAPRTSGQIDPKSRRQTALPFAAALHSIHAIQKNRMEEILNGNYQFAGLLPVVYS